MNLFNVEYFTKNHYQNIVKEALIEFRICPIEDTLHSGLNYKITTKPNLKHSIFNDWLGNKVFRFYTDIPFDQFDLQFKASITKRDSNPFEVIFPSYERENQMLKNHNYKIEFHQYLIQTNYTSLPNNFLNENTKKQKGESIWELANRINDYLNKNYAFQSGVTEAHHTAADFIAFKKGVCMDFAHLFIGIFRANHIPARYTSGYLYEGIEDGENLHSNSSMHAWAEFHIPSIGWIGIDPSNHLMADNHYLKTCHGIDYLDCQPIKGILKTEGNNITSHTVHVKRKIIDQNLSQ